MTRELGPGDKSHDGGTRGEGVQLALFLLDTLSDPTAGQVRPAAASGVDLRLVKVDAQGRLPLRATAAALGWEAGTPLVLTVEDEVLRLAGPAAAGRRRPGGIEVGLDRRLRLQLPYALRTTTPFRPGTRLMVLEWSEGGVVAAAPLATVIDRFLGAS